MKKMKSSRINTRLGWCCACFFLCGLLACGRGGEAKVRLSSNERALMDSLYIKQIEQFRPMWDSICENRFETAVVAAVDSLIITRTEEEIRLRARIIEPK